MDPVLLFYNGLLEHRFNQLILLLTNDPSNPSIPSEFQKYSEDLISDCRKKLKALSENADNINANKDTIYKPATSQIQLLADYYNLLDVEYADCVARTLAYDYACIRTIRWLHDNHRQIKDVSAGLTFGLFEIRLRKGLPVLYMLPSSCHNGLLNLPLLFHEFGHYLFRNAYSLFKLHIDNFVGRMKPKISEYVQNTYPKSPEIEQNEMIDNMLEAWKKWIEEIYCDAVGLTIGGPCFANCMSAHLYITEFHFVPYSYEELVDMGHPVSYIRIKLMTERARSLGWGEEVARIDHDWDKTKSVIKDQTSEGDYYGFFKDAYKEIIHTAIERMIAAFTLVHTTPANIRSDVTVEEEKYTPVDLLNTAWAKYLEGPSTYNIWKKGLEGKDIKFNNI